MQTSKTFKILFRLIKARKKNNGAPIYVRITVNGKRAEFSTDLFYPIDEWDSKTSRAIGRASKARTLNDELDIIKVDLKEAYKELTRELQKTDIVYHLRRIKVNHPQRVKLSIAQRMKVNH